MSKAAFKKCQQFCNVGGNLKGMAEEKREKNIPCSLEAQ